MSQFDVMSEACNPGCSKNEAANTLTISRSAFASLRKPNRMRTRDLVGLLLSHGSRAMRNSRPRVNVRLVVKNRNGGLAVRFSYKPQNGPDSRSGDHYSSDPAAVRP